MERLDKLRFVQRYVFGRHRLHGIHGDFGGNCRIQALGRRVEDAIEPRRGQVMEKEVSCSTVQIGQAHWQRSESAEVDGGKHVADKVVDGHDVAHSTPHRFERELCQRVRQRDAGQEQVYRVQAEGRQTQLQCKLFYLMNQGRVVLRRPPVVGLGDSVTRRVSEPPKAQVKAIRLGGDEDQRWSIPAHVEQVANNVAPGELFRALGDAKHAGGHQVGVATVHGPKDARHGRGRKRPDFQRIGVGRRRHDVCL
mmetsp:Transcript_15981/g.41341  ORF Transcript_15981/g.41341 Transcript_15981/m.41341 type:complete len:252 (+) Transcript_15981:3004-3759(+)